LAGFVADIVVDPQYPYMTDVEVLKFIDPKFHTNEPTIIDDRRVICYREQATAGYAFGEKEHLAKFLSHLNLLENDIKR
jgi:hypothetical protein